MSQCLVFPVRQAKITAGYKAKKYREKYGYDHYGVDMICVNDKYFDVYACGNGKVIATGNDGANSVGNIVVIKYNDVEVKGGGIVDLICTYFHLQDGSICVKPGDYVNASTKVGLYGKTGYGIVGEHLHIQFDTDVYNPLYCTGIAGRGNILKSGTVDSTVNPVNVLCNWDETGKDREWRGEMVQWHDDWTSDEMSLWTDLRWTTPVLDDISTKPSDPDEPITYPSSNKYKEAIEQIKAIVNNL